LNLLAKEKRLTILLIEDSAEISANIGDYLESLGHVMDFARAGDQGLSLALENYYDLIILDLMLPGMDGLEVCEEIRKRASRHIPIIMLTARDTLDDKVKGFNLGADDYLTKPFALEELAVRCLALSGRKQLNQSSQLSIGELTIDRGSREVTRSGKTIQLNQIPLKILIALADSHPRVVSRSELCQIIWGDDLTESDSLRSHIYQLRQALDKPFETALIKTVHGVGFGLDIKQ